ncbi:MAG: hypothetical protein PHI63_04695 [Patescibacteria group bacterium]|nr:hypothetical protein [Patescibacteria group bacterium]
MELRAIRIIRTWLLTLAVIGVFVVTVGGPWHVLSMAMAHEHGGAMADCPLMGTITLCTMTPVEHLSLWQRAFMAVTEQIGSLLFWVLLPVVVWFFWSQRQWLIEQVKKRPPDSWLQRFLTYHKTPGGHILQWAFSTGILHPKIYPEFIA